MGASHSPASGGRPASGGNGQGPGKWIQVNEKMSPRSAKYQTQLNGRPPGWAYRANGVRFDDFNGKALIEGKGPGYAKFIDKQTGKLYRWFRGGEALLAQAERQYGAAGRTPVEWHIAEPELVNWLRKQFVDKHLRITVIHTPAAP
jgi:hypothetical protein